MEPSEVTVLVSRAIAGDRAAWNAIVDEYAGVVWSVVRGFRLGEAQAADAVQTTWLRLIEHLTAIRDPERLAGWLRTTARRSCLEVIRTAGREQLVADHPEDAATARRQGDGRDDGPETALLRREQRDAVRRVLATLPERQQQLMALLVAVPPVSYEEISARLGMPVGSIGPTRSRVLARLREALEREGICDMVLS
jgi:RNA polymerase sigma factor (sigma-70 family)